MPVRSKQYTISFVEQGTQARAEVQSDSSFLMKGTGKRQRWIGTSIRVVLRIALSGFGCIMSLVNRDSR